MNLPGGGLIRLHESQSSLADSEARIAAYVLEHPREFVNLTVHDLSERSGSSPAAVVRLWKSLGFDGYRDFQLRVASDLQSETNFRYTEITADHSFAALLHSVQEASINSIQGTLSLLKETDVHAMAVQLSKAARILTFGAGASAEVANDLALKLLRIGFPVYWAPDFHTSATAAAQLKPGDVCVAVSYSGQTSEVCEVAEICRQRNADVFSITRFGDTALSKLSSLCLYVSSAEPEPRIAATASRTAALIVVDTLFLYLANLAGDTLVTALESTRSAVGGHRLP